MHKNIIGLKREYLNGNLEFVVDFDYVRKNFVNDDDIKFLEYDKVVELYRHFIEFHELTECEINGYLYLENPLTCQLYEIVHIDNFIMKLEQLFNGTLKNSKGQVTKILKLESVDSVYGKRMTKSLYQDLRNGF